jgi:hypothetical protein
MVLMLVVLVVRIDWFCICGRTGKAVESDGKDAEKVVFSNDEHNAFKCNDGDSAFFFFVLCAVS